MDGVHPPPVPDVDWPNTAEAAAPSASHPTGTVSADPLTALPSATPESQPPPPLPPAFTASSSLTLLAVSPLATWLRFGTLAFAAYQTLVLLSHLLSGRGCSSLRYRRVLQFWIVYGVLAFVSGGVREALRLSCAVLSLGASGDGRTVWGRWTRALLRLHAWGESLAVFVLVFPVHRGVFEVLAPLLVVGGTSLNDWWTQSNGVGNAAAGATASSTGSATAATSDAAVTNNSSARRRLRRRAMGQYNLFEMASLLYRRLLAGYIEAHEPEIDLWVSRARMKTRQGWFLLRQLLSFVLAWVLANSGNAAEAAMLGSAALQGAQVGLAGRVARMRRATSVLLHGGVGDAAGRREGAASAKRRGRPVTAAEASPWRAEERTPRLVSRSSDGLSDDALEVAHGDASFHSALLRSPGGQRGRRSASPVAGRRASPRSPSVASDAGGGDDHDEAGALYPMATARDTVAATTVAATAPTSVSALDELALWLPRLLPPLTEAHHFPYRFRSTEDEMGNEMYAADDAQLLHPLAEKPRIIATAAAVAPSRSTDRHRSLWASLKRAFTGQGSGASSAPNTFMRRSVPAAATTPVRSLATPASPSASGASARTPHGSMKLIGPGELGATFMEDESPYSPESRARAYERVRTYHRSLRRHSAAV
ncbi:hypothetical protein CDCA_CDCA01G0464 [Cyanidium caldarium]|uniref:Uncharacterized protein n=1 Tax=Cyanidium caldarium TaxID=2771 RepID=A0AAV9IQN0_CYACA|nr:hypothetical protein CDCA_CDCA01G0464 [Cyanidium caldarium]